MVKTRKIFLLLVFILIISFLCPIVSNAINDATVTENGNSITVTGGEVTDIEENKKDAVNKITEKLESYKTTITFIGGIATMTMIVVFIRHFIKLGTLGTEHWALKRNSIMALLWSGLAAALLGASTTIFAISYNIFK